MIKHLFVKNVALIERLDMELCAGFNVLTGETGAGKSIVIDAVNLALGERASKELIKYGADKATVEMTVDADGLGEVARLLESLEIDPEEELLISRELSASGRNVCRINGTPVPLASLKQVTDLLVDVHGQHEHQSLLLPSRHMDYLDLFAGKGVLPLKREVAALYKRYREIKGELLDGFVSEAERSRQIDMLQYQIDEISKAQISAGEEAELLQERRLLANAERIQSALAAAHAELSDERGALERLASAQRALQEISGYGTDYEALAAKANEAYYALEDLTYSARDQLAAFEYDPQRLDELEQRLELYASLKRKYGVTTEEILVFLQSSQEQLEKLMNASEHKAKLQRALDECEAAYRKAAAELFSARQQAAQELSKRTVRELKQLGMEKSRFEAAFTPLETFSSTGMERVEFLISTNPGEPVKPLAKVASGGELSRIMLAFKAIFAEADHIPTLIFDEIDTGIGGQIASVVGEKIAAIAGRHQVICITHLAQIAARADAHFLVEKRDDGTATTSQLHQLTEQERVRHIARMMGGSDDSPLALQHARELIDSTHTK